MDLLKLVKDQESKGSVRHLYISTHTHQCCTSSQTCTNVCMYIPGMFTYRHCLLQDYFTPPHSLPMHHHCQVDLSPWWKLEGAALGSSGGHLQDLLAEGNAAPGILLQREHSLCHGRVSSGGISCTLPSLFGRFI